MYQKKPKNNALKVITFAVLITSLFLVLLRWSCELHVGSMDVKVADSIIEQLKKERIESKKR